MSGFQNPLSFGPPPTPRPFRPSVDPGRIIDTRSSSNTSRTARIPSIYKRKHHKDTKKNKNMHTTKAGPPMIPPPASLSFNPYGHTGARLTPQVRAAKERVNRVMSSGGSQSARSMSGGDRNGKHTRLYNVDQRGRLIKQPLTARHRHSIHQPQPKSPSPPSDAFGTVSSFSFASPSSYAQSFSASALAQHRQARARSGGLDKRYGLGHRQTHSKFIDAPQKRSFFGPKPTRLSSSIWNQPKAHVLAQRKRQKQRQKMRPRAGRRGGTGTGTGKGAAASFGHSGRKGGKGKNGARPMGAPEEDQVEFSKVSLFVACNMLPLAQISGRRDTVVALSVKDPESGSYQFVAQTERIEGSKSPQYRRPFILDHWSGEDMQVNLSVYDVEEDVEDISSIKEKEMLGSATVSLRDVLSSPEVDFPMLNKRGEQVPHATFLVRSRVDPEDPLLGVATEIQLRVSCRDLHSALPPSQLTGLRGGGANMSSRNGDGDGDGDGDADADADANASADARMGAAEPLINPVVTASRFDPQSGQYAYVGGTEQIRKSAHPDFDSKIIVTHFSKVDQRFAFNVYNVGSYDVSQTLIGSINVRLSKLVDHPGQPIAFRLRDANGTPIGNSSIFFVAEPMGTPVVEQNSASSDSNSDTIPNTTSTPPL